MSHTIVPILSILLLQILNSEGCSPPQGNYTAPSVVELIANDQNNVIIMGKVLRHSSGSYSTSYTAEIKVSCILKGPRLPRRVSVTEAGYVPGMCTPTVLDIGKSYIIPAYTPYDNDYTVLRATGFAVAKKDFRQALRACGLNQPTYPNGVNESRATTKCPTPLPPGQCVPGRRPTNSGH